MGSLSLTVENRRALIAECQDLYDDHRFLDAYRLSAGYWVEPTLIDELSAEEMILAARLASRVGGMRLSRHLYRKAHERDPQIPVVRYFTRHISGPHDLMLDQLLAFERNPELGGTIWNWRQAGRPCTPTCTRSCVISRVRRTSLSEHTSLLHGVHGFFLRSQTFLPWPTDGRMQRTVRNWAARPIHDHHGQS